MRRAAWYAAMPLVVAPAAGQSDAGTGLATGDLANETVAFVELSAPREEFFVQEPIRLTLRFGLDREFLRRDALQLFARPLDIPVQLAAPWIDELPGAVSIGDDEEERQRFTFALNDEIAEATLVGDRDRGGRTFRVLELDRLFLAERAGELEVPAPGLRFAYATSFRQDFLSASVPLDRELAVVLGEPLTLRIKPLPLEGQPAGYTGAVGRFTVSADASSRDIVVGESFELVLRIEGDGNLQFLNPPRLDELAGFHVYGVVDAKTPRRRIVTYDLAPLVDDVRELPAIPFSFFEPSDPPGYHTVWTEPIQLNVRPDPLQRSRPEEGAREISGRGDQPQSDVREGEVRPMTVAAGALLTLLGLLAAWFWFLRRNRTSGLADPAGARARGALEVFCGNIARDEADPAMAFAEFLAARLGCPAAAVIAPDLPQRLLAAGVPTALAERATLALRRWVAARYGAADAEQEDRDALAALAAELDPAFRASERPTGELP